MSASDTLSEATAPVKLPHLTFVPRPVHGRWLEINTARWYQQRLRDNWRYHFSLPPIPVCNAESQYQAGVKLHGVFPSWREVLTSIFTGISISPGALRQCPNHYAFHAGRNLPDKEFRYLRTVIVTAAVYWGLNSKLRVTANLSS